MTAYTRNLMRAENRFCDAKIGMSALHAWHLTFGSGLQACVSERIPDFLFLGT